MKVILAKNMGFCFGVKRAVETVYEQAGKAEVVEDLRRKGVGVIEGRKELESIRKGTVIIRAHGVAKDVYEQIAAQGLQLIDATCPFVKRIHRIVEEESRAGRQIIVVGSPLHPEVQGIIGWCRTPAVTVETPEEAERVSLPKDGAFCMVSQTTFNYKKFEDIVEIFQKNGYNVNIARTICNATEERQKEAREIAACVDAMIVIGGRNSSNTGKLYEICRKECTRTYFIQTLDDLHLELPESVRVVGITAGASTPNNIIEEVQNYVRINF